jgi:hypothetical protein
MKKLLLATALLAASTVLSQAEIVVLSDDFNANSGTTRGFTLENGINFNINPPTTTRLTGTAADGLRYIQTDTGRGVNNYRITNNKAQVGAANGNGRFTLSVDGTAPYDFGTALGIASASVATPVTYDISIKMANNLTNQHRFSLGLATAETSAPNWDFGVQVHRVAAADINDVISRRIDTLSTGLASDVNTYNETGLAHGTEMSLRMRVTDVGAGYGSRVELFNNDVLIYDTSTDATLVNGFQFDGLGRFISFDQAGNAVSASGNVTYDDFSIVIVPEPSALALGFLAALALIFRPRR